MSLSHLSRLVSKIQPSVGCCSRGEMARVQGLAQTAASLPALLAQREHRTARARGSPSSRSPQAGLWLSWSRLSP